MFGQKHQPFHKVGLPVNESSSESAPIESIDNHIYFYSEVSSETCLDLIKELRRLDSEMQSFTHKMQTEKPIPIWLHIQSYGGGVFETLGLVDQIARLNSPTYAIVEGVAASAATIIAMSCSKTYILPSSFFMVHQLSSVMWGKYEEFKDEMALQDQLMDWIIDFYAEHTGMSKKKIKDLLKRDSWMNAKEALELGFVQEIMK